MKTAFIFASMAIFGAMANTVPSQMGIEVVRSDNGEVLVREVVSDLDELHSVVVANQISASRIEQAIMHQLRSRWW